MQVGNGHRKGLYSCDCTCPDCEAQRNAILLGSDASRAATAFTVDGIAVRFTRRRYSNRTYTWVSALLDGAWTELGDPWPSIKVSDNEIRMAIARVKKYPTCGYIAQDGEHWHCVRPVAHRGDHSPFDVDTRNADRIA